MILGVVLAGGGSTRFGSDKALATLDGRTLIARAVERLEGWCEQVVVVGRETAPALTMPDWPRPGMGPLGGIAAALHLARDQAFEAVLSCSVDAEGLPDELPGLLSPAPACLSNQPVIGLWPVSAVPVLDRLLLDETQRHSMLHFAELIGARLIEGPGSLANINTPADLAALALRN